MAYQPCHCSVTLLCLVCISFFCTPLALSVLLPFILYAPYPFNAPFLDCAFMLLRSASLYTLEFSYTTTTTYLFFVQHSYSLCCLCACNLRNASACSLRAKFLHNSSALSAHHRDSSASLVVYHLFNITVCYTKIPQPLWQFETLRHLCDSRAHLLCFSYRPQCSSSCQSPP
jgi:hypothetical protein